MNIIHKDSCQKVLIKPQAFRPRLDVETQYRAKCISCGAVAPLTREEVDNWQNLPPEIKAPLSPSVEMSEDGDFIQV